MWSNKHQGSFMQTKRPRLRKVSLGAISNYQRCRKAPTFRRGVHDTTLERRPPTGLARGR